MPLRDSPGDAGRVDGHCRQVAGARALFEREVHAPFVFAANGDDGSLRSHRVRDPIDIARDGQKRPCSLRAERLAEATRWLNQTREAWEARFDRLERFLATTETPQSAETKGDDHER